MGAVAVLCIAIGVWVNASLVQDKKRASPGTGGGGDTGGGGASGGGGGGQSGGGGGGGGSGGKTFLSCNDATKSYMKSTADLFGVLVVETGNGQGYYKHDTPTVHGLWPQVCASYGCYGNSACVAPSSTVTNDTYLPSCYNTPPAGGWTPDSLEQVGRAFA